MSTDPKPGGGGRSYFRYEPLPDGTFKCYAYRDGTVTFVVPDQETAEKVMEACALCCKAAEQAGVSHWSNVVMKGIDSDGLVKFANQTQSSDAMDYDGEDYFEVNIHTLAAKVNHKQVILTKET